MAVTDDDELGACPCHGHVHAAEVTQEAYLSIFVASDKRHYDDVPLLTLEAIYGVY